MILKEQYDKQKYKTSKKLVRNSQIMSVILIIISLVNNLILIPFTSEQIYQVTSVLVFAFAIMLVLIYIPITIIYQSSIYTFKYMYIKYTLYVIITVGLFFASLFVSILLFYVVQSILYLLVIMYENNKITAQQTEV